MYARHNVLTCAHRYGIITGKWLFYGESLGSALPRNKNSPHAILPPGGEESIDTTWSKIVKAIVTEGGVLANTRAVHAAKVSCTPGDGGSWCVV